MAKMAGCGYPLLPYPSSSSSHKQKTQLSYLILQSPLHNPHHLGMSNSSSSAMASLCVQGKRWAQSQAGDRLRVLVEPACAGDVMAQNALDCNIMWYNSFEQDYWAKTDDTRPQSSAPVSELHRRVVPSSQSVVDESCRSATSEGLVQEPSRSHEDGVPCSRGAKFLPGGEWSEPVAASAPTKSPDSLVIEGACSGEDELWLAIRSEARRDADMEPVLASFFYSTVLAHRSLYRALAFHLGNKLASDTLLSTHLVSLILDTFMEDTEIRNAIRADIRAVKERDPACMSYLQCILNFKGFLGCQAHRVAHRLWQQGRKCLALALQSRVSEEFHMDIHPAATIGRGVLFDHATGVVVGETAVIGNNVSILHNVTLGGTGASGGVRHPKLGDGVLVGAGSILLGPITVGEGAKIGAGSVVLIDVPPHTTAVGNPVRLVGGKKSPQQLEDIPSKTMDHTSFMGSWSDYVI